MRDFFEPNLDLFRERYDAGTLPSSGPIDDSLTTDERKALTPEQRRALTARRRASRQRAKFVGWKR